MMFNYMRFSSEPFKYIPLIAILLAQDLMVPVFASGDGWGFASSDDASYRVEKSIDAQDGEHLAVIDGTTLTFPISYQEEGRYWLDPFRPSGYVYQSVEAKPYLSTHLHISGFARGVKPNFAELEKQFFDYYQGAQEVRLIKFLGNVQEAEKSAATKRFDEYEQGRYEEKLSEFQRFIHNSYNDAQYGIAVILDMGGALGNRVIQAHGPTSAGAPRSNELWNRFNVEVGMPEACQSITIVMWQQGVAISEFDYLVVSEQGEKIGFRVSNFSLDAKPLFDKIIESRDLATQFSNLSFE